MPASSPDSPAPRLTREDFISGQQVRWCPGCGDYAILAQFQRLLPELGLPREKIAFVSGIGCSSRLPYYMNTYGFHTIHGRAPNIATGLKAVRPDMQVWVITGDGDALSIGANHLLHALRRNVDIKIVLVNNRIYGLTKGQTSPTSPRGTRTKSTPMGSIDFPIEPVRIAVAARATFAARTFDVHTAHLREVLRRAAVHKGSVFIEIYQNCNVFNDKAFAHFTDPAVRAERIIELAHGEKMIFGKNREKGLRFNGHTFEVVAADHPDVLVHDERQIDSTIAYGLARLRYPDYPIPVGVFRDVDVTSYMETFEVAMERVVAEAKRAGPPDMERLLRGAATWVVRAPAEAQADVVERRCPHCGHDNLTGEIFCEACGQDLEERGAFAEFLLRPLSEAIPPGAAITVTAETPVREAAQRMMEKHTGCVLVVGSDGRLIGTFTERDLLRRAVIGPVADLDATVGDLMTRDPIAVHALDSVALAVNQMAVHGFRHLPVVDSQGKPVGVYSARGILRRLREYGDK
jgi:2-oxoglutarate/2-oxoacid ferredoxin oxidoreductase subunit beta